MHFGIIGQEHMVDDVLVLLFTMGSLLNYFSTYVASQYDFTQLISFKNGKRGLYRT